MLSTNFLFREHVLPTQMLDNTGFAAVAMIIALRCIWCSSQPNKGFLIKLGCKILISWPHVFSYLKYGKVACIVSAIFFLLDPQIVYLGRVIDHDPVAWSIALKVPVLWSTLTVKCNRHIDVFVILLELCIQPKKRQMQNKDCFLVLRF